MRTAVFWPCVGAAIAHDDFVYPGKYCGLYPEIKRVFFRNVSRLINEHKFYSLSIVVSGEDFQNELTEETRKVLIGPYAFAFFCLVAANQTTSTLRKSGPARTAYLVDRGFGHQEQLNQAHDLIVRFEVALGGFRHTGALATDSDDRVPALQAADAIAWASRKIELQGGLPEGLEPLAEVLREDVYSPHATIRIPRDGIQMFADPINKWISKYGEVPKLTDIVGRQLNGAVVRLKT